MNQSEIDDSAKMLDRMGIDAQKWAAEFMRIAQAGDLIDTRGDDTEGWMIGWFANAIEAGRSAGRRETCPHDWLTLSPDLVLCRVCGMSA